MNRIEIIQNAVDVIKGKTYLEIGVENGSCFTTIYCDNKLGVDPKEASFNVRAVLNDKIKYYQMTSDDFFAGHTDVFESDKIDVAFIDGWHSYEQSLADVENCIKYLSDGGIIVMHDCNPPCAEYERPHLCNNAWKTIVNLRSLRHDLRVFVLDCDYGVGIITRGTPGNELNFSVDDIENMTYKELDKERKHLLDLKECNYLYGFLGDMISANKYE